MIGSGARRGGRRHNDRAIGMARHVGRRRATYHHGRRLEAEIEERKCQHGGSRETMQGLEGQLSSFAMRARRRDGGVGAACIAADTRRCLLYGIGEDGATATARAELRRQSPAMHFLHVPVERVH